MPKEYLNLEHLQSFLALLEQGSTQKAAAHRGQTQPTISRHVKELQATFGQPILRQAGRKLVPTDFGNLLYNTARRHLSQLERDVKTLLQDSEDPKNVTILIGARRELLVRFSKRIQFSGFLQMMAIGGKEIEERLRQGRIDIAITQRDIEHSEYVRKIFDSDEPTVIVPRKWLGEKNWRERAGQFGFAVYENQTSDVEKYLSGEKVRINYSANDWSLIEEQVHGGLSWSIVPSGFLLENRNYVTVSAPTFTNKTNIYIYYRRDLRKLAWFQDIISKIQKP